MTDLRNCPFCGGRARMISWRRGDSGDSQPFFLVECSQCGARPFGAAPGQHGYRQKDDLSDEEAQAMAAAKWNVRSP